MRLPRREEFDAARVHWLKRGGPTKADLSIIDLGQGPMVVKDFGNKAAWVRLIGRVQISRECRAYRWVGPIPGLPRLLGRIDAHALALEKIEGQELVFMPDRWDDGVAKHEQLTEIVERLHRTGLFHLDLRGIENVMLGPDGRVFVLDLAAAIWVRPKGRCARLFSSWLEMTDRAALLKWKIILNAGRLTDE